MPCSNPEHTHDWPEQGELVIQKCERFCGYCTGDAALHEWKFPWFLRRHARSVHRASHPDVVVTEIWTEAHDDPKTPRSAQIKARNSSKRPAANATASPPKRIKGKGKAKVVSPTPASGIKRRGRPRKVRQPTPTPSLSSSQQQSDSESEVAEPGSEALDVSSSLSKASSSHQAQHDGSLLGPPRPQLSPVRPGLRSSRSGLSPVRSSLSPTREIHTSRDIRSSPNGLAFQQSIGNLEINDTVHFASSLSRTSSPLLNSLNAQAEGHHFAERTSTAEHISTASEHESGGLTPYTSIASDGEPHTTPGHVGFDAAYAAALVALNQQAIERGLSWTDLGEIMRDVLLNVCNKAEAECSPNFDLVKQQHELEKTYHRDRLAMLDQMDIHNLAADVTLLQASEAALMLPPIDQTVMYHTHAHFPPIQTIEDLP